MKKKNKETEPKVVVPKASAVYNGRKAYVFTNWGLVKGQVVAQRIDKYTGLTQYKLDIDINKENKNKAYTFWYLESELHKFYFTTLVKELIKLLF